jgi:hypothetical protein
MAAMTDDDDHFVYAIALSHGVHSGDTLTGKSRFSGAKPPDCLGQRFALAKHYVHAIAL